MTVLPNNIFANLTHQGKRCSISPVNDNLRLPGAVLLASVTPAEASLFKA